MKKHEALKELRSLVATYLEGSDDAVRAAQLLTVIEESTECPSAGPRIHEARNIPDAKARVMFGCTAGVLDQELAGKDPRDIAMYAMSALSNAQELFQSTSYGSFQGGNPANTADRVRQFINIAKYAIDKAVPR